MLKNVGLEFLLRGIGKLDAGVGKKLYAVVLKRIVRGRNHDTGLEIILADQARDARGRNDSGEGNARSGLRESCSENRGDVRAGFPRVHANENLRRAMCAL